MLRGLYIASEGMVARQKAQDVLASNLANLNTTGFKADRPVFSTVYERALYRLQGGTATPIGTLSAGTLIPTTYTDFQAGALQTTGNPMDLAIEGEGFFAVQTPRGIRYTRNGAFQLNAEGVLINRQGYPVLSEAGEPIRVPKGATLTFGEDGSFRLNNAPAGRLRIVQGNLAKDEEGFFAGNATPLPNARVVVGALEASNVNLIREMISMIEILRAYESHQKVIQAHDETLGRVLNELPKI